MLVSEPAAPLRAAAAQLQRAAVDGGRAAVLVDGQEHRRARTALQQADRAAAAEDHVDRAGLDVVIVAAGGGQGAAAAQRAAAHRQ